MTTALILLNKDPISALIIAVVVMRIGFFSNRSTSFQNLLFALCCIYPRPLPAGASRVRRGDLHRHRNTAASEHRIGDGAIMQARLRNRSVELLCVWVPLDGGVGCFLRRVVWFAGEEVVNFGPH